MTPDFELNDLHVSLQSDHKVPELVRGVTFAVAAGECLGILGESGSGKSMSMKAAMGLLDHSFHVKGSAQFQGEELLGKSAEELRRLRGGGSQPVLRGERGRLRQLTALGEGFRVVRLADAPDGEAQHEGRRQDQNEKFFDFFFHTGLLKNGNTGRG